MVRPEDSQAARQTGSVGIERRRNLINLSELDARAPASVQPPALCSDEEVSEEVSDDASEGVTDNEESIYYSGFEHSDETSDDERCRV